MLKLILPITISLLSFCSLTFAQVPGGRGGIPNLTPGQTAALVQMNSDLMASTQGLTAARTAVVAASLADPRNDGNIQAKINGVKAAELTLANARAAAFAKIQASSDKLAADQVAALTAGGGVAGGRGGAGGVGRGAAGGSGAGRGAPAPGTGGNRGASVGATTIPHSTSSQANALFQMANDTEQMVTALNNARAAVTAASLNDSASVKAKVDAVGAAELTLANARAGALARIQASANKLDSAQMASLVAMGGNFGAGSFSQPEPMDFQDRRGYVSLFDGTLKGWDGNPKIWRVEDGAIVGESTPTNPSGNSYIVNKTVEAHDFTLKFEIKVEGSGGSGLQYRSKTGIPWRRPIAANLQPVNLNWMQIGPQADFWPSQIYTGQVYSENTPMGIEAYRGQVVEGSGMGARRLMGTIGDLAELGKLVKMNDWNEYTIIARGPTVLHIVNGQLMAAFVDDDPASSNNWTGNFGIEIEATTRVSVRNIWLKKIN